MCLLYSEEDEICSEDLESISVFSVDSLLSPPGESGASEHDSAVLPQYSIYKALPAKIISPPLRSEHIGLNKFTNQT